MIDLSLVIDCGKPVLPSSIELIGDKFTVGSEVLMVCKPGFKMVSGQAKRKCNEDGQWEQDTPSCKCRHLKFKLNPFLDNFYILK